MATNRLLYSAFLALTLFISGASACCMAQNSSLLIATRPRYAHAPDHLSAAVPGYFEINTSRINEIIPAAYRKRYLQWRSDYLSTNAGRAKWSRYAGDPNFRLTITVSKQLAEGAIVDGFQWDTNGALQSATIRLGSRLSCGYPNAIHYPITFSLATGELPPELAGTILAATKIAHEFGHPDLIMSMDGGFYQLQNTLSAQYNRIFYSNGYNCNDPRLLALADRMEGTPVSIMEDRESWAEAGSLRYLEERLTKNRQIKMPQPVKEAIASYYLTHPGRL